MRILCISPVYWPAFQLGGPITAVHGFNSALVKKGVDVTVYTTSSGLDGRESRAQEVIIDGVKVRYFDVVKLFDFLGDTGWQFSLEMQQALKKNLKSFDIVSIHGIWNYPPTIALHMCNNTGLPYIVSPHGTLDPYNIVKKAWKKKMYYHLFIKKYIKKAILHYFTESEASESMKHLNLSNSTAIVPNGIALEEFNDLPQKDSLLLKYPILTNKTVILYLGRIHPIKGLDILIDSFAAVLREKPEAYLLLVGGGDSGYELQVRKWIKEKKVTDHIIFTGLIHGQEKRDALLGSDIFVLPSYSEAFSMSILEAMACRLPVIITNKCNFPDVEQKGAGIVVTPEAEPLTRALMGLISSPEKRRMMGNKGRQLVEDKFTWDILADRMIKTYGEMAKKPRKMTKLPLSVMILTFNEEKNIEDCLKSVYEWADEICVIDSGSKDDTLQIVNNYTDKVCFHKFETHSKQWEWGLRNVTVRNDWVLGIDADQRITEELADELKELFLNGSAIENIDGFYLKRKQYFMGKWIKHGGYYPRYLLKLFRINKVQVDVGELMDHHFYVLGNTSRLNNDFIEENKNEDINFLTTKHNHYASLQAEETFHNRNKCIINPSLFGNWDQRRLFMKNIWVRLPIFIRAFLYFIYRYVIRLGFLDGKEGLIFHSLQGFWYRFLVDAKIYEKYNNSEK